MRILSNEIKNNEGEIVELKGWVDSRRDHGKLIFIDLRDRKGIAQVVFAPGNKDLLALADKIRPEWVVRISGKVQRRPEGMVNKDIPSGEHEVSAEKLDILTEAKTLPFDISGDGFEINEELRMKYRYLDLRRKRMQRNIRDRSKILAFIREFLNKEDFVEIETPILGRSTPEGARDYLVPSRLNPGSFYALPQSPQQYKQLLMVAGFEKYFQMARCFRDEDTRGDRQPEFTQIDIEMSFVEEEDILKLTESFVIELVSKLFPHKRISKRPFPRISYAEVMEKYGSDRPDLRENSKDENELAFAFVVDFPMFEWKEKEDRWDAVHHPFTMPKVEDVVDFEEKFKNNPGAIIAKQYDLVLNGFEVAGGSIRIHKPQLLAKIFESMKNKPEDVKEKFGHLLEAFEYGVPPHGGIAFGFDRLCAVMFNEPNIREVISFSKTGDGRDLMMGAPSSVDSGQLDDLGINIKSNKD